MSDAKEIRDRNKTQNFAKKRKCYIGKPDYVPNPLLRYPRNMKCFCGKTELKAKKCCLPKVLHFIKEDDAKKLDQEMKMFGL